MVLIMHDLLLLYSQCKTEKSPRNMEPYEMGPCQEMVASDMNMENSESEQAPR